MFIRDWPLWLLLCLGYVISALVLFVPYAWLAGVTGQVGVLLVFLLPAPALGLLLYLKWDSYHGYNWLDDEDGLELNWAIHWICLPLYCNVSAYFLSSVGYMTLSKIMHFLRFWSLFIVVVAFVITLLLEYWRLKRQAVKHAG